VATSISYRLNKMGVLRSNIFDREQRTELDSYYYEVENKAALAAGDNK